MDIIPSNNNSTFKTGFDDCIYRDKNNIYFNCTISSDSTFLLMKYLREAENDILKEVKLAKKIEFKDVNEDLVKIDINPNNINLHISTYGGVVSYAFAVVDMIEKMEVPVHTIITGYVASAGTLISIAGKKRYMQKRALALLHEIRGGHWGKFSDIKDGFDNIQKIMDNVIDYYVEKTKLTKEELTEFLSRDRNWNVQECIDKGVVDEIW
jgi:ATP-dependent protease ClpP protease subunit